ncbi:LamG-like jellyroll fold domain-containing protein [Streptomyces sp. NPDC053427]|uniref:LamG-like jellyroll fold domain-containing protein n=1 Tax=Streptomyces sp. NPDC053427 TaxID=3365701 RepID=UPI0037CF4889
MSSDFLDVLRGGLTPVYDRGMERVTLPLRSDGSGGLRPADDGSRAYRDRWGRTPDAPRYLLAPTRDTAEPLTVRVAFRRRTGGPEEETEVRFPAGWPGGDTIAVELPGRADEFTDELRITALRPHPPAPRAADDWQLTALLGNLAKLLWVIGRDYQDLGRRLTEVAAQRNATTARGAGLDLLGQDLGAPRFPARPYSWDADTVALYHLDDTPPDGTANIVPNVADIGARFGAPDHHGVNHGAEAGRTGRFSFAFGFTAPNSSITVSDHSDFAVAPGADLTAEAVVRPDHTTTDTGAVLTKRARLDDDTVPGWSLAIGTFRGIDHNLRLSLGDGTAQVRLFADRDLGDGCFHHLAAVVRRTPDGTAVGLHLDGTQVARAVVPELGALTSIEPLVIGHGQETSPDGPAPAQYHGLIEEVRISRIARTSFDPVTGEGDDHYRRRLHIFQRWLVPTPDALQDGLNRTAGRVTGDHTPESGPGSFVIDETTGRIATGSLDVRVLPPPLTTGQCIAADGDRLRTEAQVVGTAAGEPDFDPGWLCRHPGAAGLAFADDGCRLMQLGVRRTLDILLTRIGAQPFPPRTLIVVRAYDPTATDLFSVGRALLLRLDGPRGPAGPGLTAELGVQAHAAGFGWVCHTADGLLRVAQPPTDAFAITLRPDVPPVPGTDTTAGQTAAISLDPDPGAPTEVEVRWSVTRGGPGSATAVPASSGKAAALLAATAGDVTVTVEVSRAGHTRSGRRTIRIGLPDTALDAAGSVGRDGRLGATEAQAAGPPADDFDPTYLQLRTDDLSPPARAVVFGPAPAARRMQPATGAALERLLDVLGPAAGKLHVLSAFSQADHGLAGQGRVLVLAHDTLSAPALGARAFAAGFDHIALQDPAAAGAPATVRVAVAAGEHLRAEVVGAGVALSGAAGNVAAEVRVGETVTLTVNPRVVPVSACLAPDGARLFLADPGRHRVLALRLEAPAATALPVPALATARQVDPLPGALAFVADRLFVAHRGVGMLAVLDPATLGPATPPVTLPGPAALATDDTRLFVACAGDRTLRAFDPQTAQQTGRVNLPATPTAIAAAPNSPLLAVLLDGGGFCLVTRAAFQLQGGVVGAGTPALCAAFAPDGTKLYVGTGPATPGAGSASVQVYPTGGTTPIATVGGLPSGTVPVTMCAATDQRHLYVATAGSETAAGRVHVLDPAADTLLPTAFSPGGDCRVLAASPAGAAYRPCLLAAVESAGTLLLADQTPLAGDPPLPPQLAFRQVLALEPDAQLTWSAAPAGPGRAEPYSPGSPVTRVTGLAPGVVRLRADYFRGSPVLPYQCEVRLRPDLDARPEVVVSKDQYDLVLNILNWFQPIGVEFRTGRLRGHVRELDDAEPGLPPAYTFPAYRTGDRRRPARFTRPGRDDDPGADGGATAVHDQG